MLQSAIFDMDGVIVDSHSVHKEAWRRLFNLLGKSVSDEELEYVCDGGKRVEILQHFLGDLPLSQLEEYGRQKHAFFLQGADCLSLVPGVAEFIAALRACGTKLAVATSACRTRTEYVLNRFALREYFDEVVTGDDVSRGKPDPTIFQRACAQLHGVPRTSLVMEDAVPGVQAAKRAGMNCLGIASQARAPLLYGAGADWVQPDFTAVRLTTLLARFGVRIRTSLPNLSDHLEANP